MKKKDVAIILRGNNLSSHVNQIVEITNVMALSGVRRSNMLASIYRIL